MTDLDMVMVQYSTLHLDRLVVELEFKGNLISFNFDHSRWYMSRRLRQRSEVRVMSLMYLCLNKDGMSDVGVFVCVAMPPAGKFDQTAPSPD